MLEWIAYQVPWWVWIVVAAIAVGLVHRFFGVRQALGTALLLGVMILYSRARQRGWKDREAKIQRDRLKAIQDRKASDAEVDQMDDAKRDGEWDRWLRDKR